LNCNRQICEKYTNIKFRENRHVEAKLLRTDRKARRSQEWLFAISWKAP